MIKPGGKRMFMRKTFIYLLLLLCIGSDIFADVSPLSSGIIMDADENAIYIEDLRWGRFTKKSYEIKAPYKIYKVDLKDNSKAIFYEGDSKGMSWLSMSPDEKFIAVIRGWQRKFAEILVINKKLKVEAVSISDSDGIVRYVWSPDSKKIAYISGVIAERSVVKSTGVWVYDIEKKEKKKIADRGSQLDWVKSGEIYVVDYDYKKGKSGMPINDVYESAVYKYESGLVTGKKVLGNDFSLDGRYSIGPKYWMFSAMSDEERAKVHYRVYDLQKSTAIPESKLSNVFADPETITWGYFYWVKDNRLVLDAERTINGIGGIYQLICDVENNQILKAVKGKLVGFNSDRSKLVIYSDGKFSAVDVP